MHREMCRTNRDRDCLHGQKGACRACPYRKGGALYKTAAEKHEYLVQSWYHAVVIGRSAIHDVPVKSGRRLLRNTVRERVEHRYRRAARRLTAAQKRTITKMRNASANDAAAAAGCSTDDVWLWLLPRYEHQVPHYERPLELVA